MEFQCTVRVYANLDAYISYIKILTLLCRAKEKCQNCCIYIATELFTFCLDTTGATTSIQSVLPVLAKMLHGMRTETRLHICHSLDKDITGTLLLAQTEEAADHIHTLFKALQVERKYWYIRQWDFRHCLCFSPPLLREQTSSVVNSFCFCFAGRWLLAYLCPQRAL